MPVGSGDLREKREETGEGRGEKPDEQWCGISALAVIVPAYRIRYRMPVSYGVRLTGARARDGLVKSRDWPLRGGGILDEPKCLDDAGADVSDLYESECLGLGNGDGVGRDHERKSQPLGREVFAVLETD